MRVIVSDKESNSHFRSEVYAVVNSGCYERQLVLVPGEGGGHFKLYDIEDTEAEGFPRRIWTVLPQEPDSWIFRYREQLNKRLEPYDAFLPPEICFYEYRGFPWLLEDTATLTRLLMGEAIPLRGSPFEGKLYSDLRQPGWTDVESQADADALLKEVYCFHDSVLAELHYISGSCADGGSLFPFDNVRSVRMQFQSQLCKPFELEFQAVSTLNLRPASEEYTSEISGASLLFRDETFYFYDYELEEPDPEYGGTWLEACGLRWRFLP